MLLKLYEWKNVTSYITVIFQKLLYGLLYGVGFGFKVSSEVVQDFFMIGCIIVCANVNITVNEGVAIITYSARVN